MDLKDWCEWLRRYRNIEINCDDWSAFEIELMKLIDKNRVGPNIKSKFDELIV